MLDELTGKVHEYNGVGLGEPLTCNCDLVKESSEANKLTAIDERHLEEGIWEEADCLKSE